MSKETVIMKLNCKKEKERAIREQARNCLADRVLLSNPKENLSNQLFEDAPTLYLNPTEKMFISNLVVPNEAFVTVLGSGDFTIDASFHGAGEILTFDINGNQFYPAALKLKGLQNMSYEDYWNFFSETASPDYLSPEKYKELKLKSEQDLRLYAFFDEVMSQREKEQINYRKYLRSLGLDSNMLKQMVFLMGMDPEQISDVVLDKLISRIDPRYSPSETFRTISGMQGVKTKGSYLENETSYQQAQKSIKKSNVSFLKTDIANLKTFLDASGYTTKPEYNRFKAIYLSNIPEYINGEVFARIVEEQLMPLLQEGGVIAYCCQSTNVQTLNMSDEELNKLKNSANLLINQETNIVSQYQMINTVEGLKKIREKYDVDFMETETLSSSNGLEENDTYVYIKK